MIFSSRRAGFAVLSSLILSGLPAAAQPAISLADFERELKAVLAAGHARFIKEHAAEIKELTTVPADIVPKFRGAPVAAAKEDALTIKQRLLLMGMQVNTLETIRLTMEGLRRLRAPDAPSEDQNAVAKAVIGGLHDRIRAIDDASQSERGAGMHEAVKLARKRLGRLRELSDSLRDSKSWGAEGIGDMGREMSEQLEAIAAAVEDDSLTPVLKTDDLKAQWDSFNKAQDEGVRAADVALAQAKVTEDEYAVLIGGRRDLARMWELYQEGWLKR